MKGLIYDEEQKDYSFCFYALLGQGDAPTENTRVYTDISRWAGIIFSEPIFVFTLEPKNWEASLFQVNLKIEEKHEKFDT